MVAVELLSSNVATTTYESSGRSPVHALPSYAHAT